MIQKQKPVEKSTVKLASKLERMLLADKALAKEATKFNDLTYAHLSLMKLPEGSTAVKVVNYYNDFTHVFAVQVKKDSVALFVMNPHDLKEYKYISGQLGDGKGFFVAMPPGCQFEYQHNQIAMSVARAFGFFRQNDEQRTNVYGKYDYEINDKNSNQRLHKDPYESKGKKGSLWVDGGGYVTLNCNLEVFRDSHSFGQGPNEKAQVAFQELIKANKEELVKVCKEKGFEELSAMVEGLQ